jgi:hypothetical protein
MNALTRIAQQLIRAKLNQFKVRRKSLPFVRGKRTQQMITVQVGLKGQHDVLLLYFRAVRRFLFRPVSRFVMHLSASI